VVKMGLSASKSEAAASSGCAKADKTEQDDDAKLTLESLANGLKDGKFRNVVVLCGAGISTSAGVPDFRSPSAGLYFKIRNIPDLPYPEAVFDGGFFRSNPVPFYRLVREIYPERLEPTLTHRFYKLLDNKGILTRVYTQNIDALEFLPGLAAEKVVEAHGTFHRSYCTKCKKTYTLEWLKNAIFHPPQGERGEEGVPRCEACGGVVRPDVVLFGEPLPDLFWSRARSDFPDCDLLITMGTSLAVAPFNSLVGRSRSRVPRVYIAKGKPGSAGGFLPWLMGLAGDVSFKRKTDLVLQADCDQTVRKICQLAGWEQELDQLPYDVMHP